MSGRSHPKCILSYYKYMGRKTVTRKEPSFVKQKETHKLLGTTVTTRTCKSCQGLTLLEAGQKIAGSL